MARRKNPRGSVGNTVAAHELALYAESNSDLYRQRIEPVIKNLSRKRSKNIYDRALALKLWKYVADDAAQRYTKEHGGGKGYGIFAAATRRKAAAEIQDHYLNEVEGYQQKNPRRKSKHDAGMEILAGRWAADDARRLRTAPDVRRTKRDPRRMTGRKGFEHGYIVCTTIRGKQGYFNGRGIDTDKNLARFYSSQKAAARVGQKIADKLHVPVQIRTASREANRSRSTGGMGYRQNPARAGSPQVITGRETFRDTARAAKLFKDFHGDPPGYKQRVSVALPKVALAIGSLDGVDYTTVRDGVTERYHHPFKRDARPALAVSHSGKQLLILGGRYTFTDRGIEDG